MVKIGIVEHTDFSSLAINNLLSLGTVSYFNVQSESLKEFIGDKDVLFVRLNYFYGEELLSHARNLKIICSPTTGLNHIDIDYTSKRNIKLVSLKGETDFLSQITATSEHNLGLIISLIRNYQKIFRSEAQSDFNRDLVKGYELSSLKVGIIGLGRIGTHLVKYLSALSAEVYFFDSDTHKSNELATGVATIKDLINSSDIIILSASYSDNNQKMISCDMLDLMHKKYFINTSRGELVDEQYLLDKIEQKHFAGVAIDVYVSEQEVPNNRQRIIDLARKELNFLYTPHMGGATISSMIKTELFIVKKLSCLVDQGVSK
jgi:D-3-phosphoglycerate dehydrogenase